MDNSFQLHIDPEEPKDPKKEKKGIKAILNDAGRQLVATVLILVVGFFAMNFGAYYQIVEKKVNEFIGTEKDTSLEEIVEINRITEQNLMESGKTSIAQAKSIPDINIDVTPPDFRLVIPKIDQNLPVITVPSTHVIDRDWDALENDIQDKLKDGIVHYPATSLPDRGGNTVITGHSSYFPWDPGRFKDVFALLHDVDVGDKVALYYKQKKYIYQISEKDIVLPSNIDVLRQPGNKEQVNQLTLITCTPIGTNLKRLIVTGDLLEVQ
jgi:sortase A